jgi:D-threo-aldose 1-dehydrogenase
MKAPANAPQEARSAGPLPTRTLGRSGLRLTALGFGGSGIGNMYEAVSEREAIATLDAAYDAGMRCFDTAPLYGHGLSEARTGSALRRFADPSVVLSTKVGWRLRPAHGQPSGAGQFKDITAFSRFPDYSYDGTLRSFEDSLQRLNVDRIDIALIHDVDRRNQGEGYPAVFRAAMDGAYRALLSLREQKLVGAIGCGLNEWEACQDFAEAGDFDCFLLAGRYTLLHQESLQSFLPLCERRGIGIILGGPYNSGILASGAVQDAWLHYAPAPAEALQRVQALDQACRRHGVPLKAAALQLPLHHPCVASVIPGMRSPQEVADNLAMLRTPVPAALWQELKAAGLIAPAAPISTPAGPAPAGMAPAG